MRFAQRQPIAFDGEREVVALLVTLHAATCPYAPDTGSALLHR